MKTLASDALLAVDALAGGYGDTRILRGVSFALGRGQVLGVLGRNGVGKTTLMRLLAGFLPAMAGSITFDGRTFAATKPHVRRRLGVAYAPQERCVFDNLRVDDNLTLHRARRGLEDYEGLFETFPRVRERLGLAAGHLSGGEKKLVSFCRALADRAPLTLLDEPSEGVQPANLERMAAVLRERCAAGASFILVEQNISFLQSVMHGVMVLDHGDVVAAGPVGEFDRGRLEACLRV